MYTNLAPFCYFIENIYRLIKYTEEFKKDEYEENLMKKKLRKLVDAKF